MQAVESERPLSSLCERARAALARGHLHRARDLVDIGVNARPRPHESAELLLVRARAELLLGLPSAAKRTAQHALMLTPNARAEAHGLIASAAAQLGKWEEAVAGYARAAALDPNASAWHAGRASALLALDDAEGAAAHANTAVSLEPANVDAALVLGRVALRQGEPELAISWLGRAAERAPERADVRSTLGVALAANGDFAQGLREYEWRQRLSGWNPRRFDIAAWAGQDLRGKRLLVWSEQGLGDSLQFARFALGARVRGACVVFHGEPRLVRLFRSCAGFDEVHSLHAERPRADFQASLISLAALLGAQTAHFGSLVPYLKAEPALCAAFRDRLALASGQRALRVALVWQGNPGFCDDEQRSIALAHLVPLLSAHARRVEFVSLQKGFGQDQMHFLPKDAPIRDLGSEIDGGGDAFVDSAAVLENVDLVLTTDTAIAHLAGALGRPVWTLLARVPDWRWGVTGTTTPWYPSMRLFRQARAGDWPGVVAEIAAALERWVELPRA